MMWPPETDNVPEDLKHGMGSLFCQQPGAVFKLSKWVQQWKDNWGEIDFDVLMPICFHRICEQAHEAAL